MRPRPMWPALLVLVLAACAESAILPTGPTNPPPPNGGNPAAAPPDTLIGVPLMDMAGTYKGFAGGLYPGGNTMPQAHFDAGLAFADAIEPLDADGNPDPGGRYALMSLGMSNTQQHFATFIGRVGGDAAVNDRLVVVNGAQGGQAGPAWVDPSLRPYDQAETFLGQAGLTERQVQVLWILQANPGPTEALPSASADAFELLEHLGNTVRAAKVRYPNLRMIFFSTRIYSCARSGLNPEPYAYESGFTVKWLIEAQIEQMAGGAVDQRIGELRYDDDTAPWLGWSAYLWADGENPRSDGLVWLREDLQDDCTHPSQLGTEKASTRLLDFFKTSPLSEWFLD